MPKFAHLLIIFLLFLLIIPITVLEVRIQDSNELVYQQLAKLEDTFDVKWKHSVTLQPVIETYKLEDTIDIFNSNGF